MEVVNEAVTPGEATSTGEATSGDKSNSKMLAEFARRERALRAKEEAFKSREKEWHTKEQEYQTKYIPKDLISKDPWKVLTEAGVDHQSVINQALNPPSETELKIQQLEGQIKQLLGGLEERDKKAQEAQTDDYKRAVDQIRDQTKALVAKSTEEFEVIKAYGEDAEEAVVTYIEEYFKKTKKILPVEEAAKIIEDHLFNESLKVAQTNKIKAKMGIEKPQETEKPQAQGIGTLTHQQTTSTKPMSARDRAILAFEGKLNKG